MKRVLIIGQPFLYEMVDIQRIRRAGVQCYFAYPEGATVLSHQYNAVFYKHLSFEEISHIIKHNNIEFLVCFNDFFMIEVAKLRHAFGMTGIGYPEIECFRVKEKSIEMVADVVKTPKTLRYIVDYEYHDLIKELDSEQFYIKPNSLAGSQGGIHITSQASYDLWKTSSYVQDGDYIAQPYIEKTLFHCDFIIQNGVIQYMQARQYTCPNHLFLEGKILASLEIIDETIQKTIEIDAIKVAHALSYYNGVMHMEFFMGEDNQPVFLETNIRQPGAGINLIHQKRAGISFETAMVLIETGVEMKIEPSSALSFVAGYIPVKQGRVTEIQAPALTSHFDFDIRVRKNQICEKPSSLSHASVAFCGLNSDYQQLMTDYKTIEAHGMIIYDEAV